MISDKESLKQWIGLGLASQILKAIFGWPFFWSFLIGGIGAYIASLILFKKH